MVVGMMVGVGCGGDKDSPTGPSNEVTKGADGQTLEVETEKWDNGNIKVEFQYYRDGDSVIKHGWYREYYVNKEKRSEGTYKYDIKDGKWMYYDTGGIKIYEELWENGTYPLLACYKFADENWDPLDYIVWRGSRNSRNSSINHALPCSSYVDTYLETGKFTGCDDFEIRQYYELIGKYDQFVAGWGDLVRVDTENKVAPTSVDSVENFLSDHRLNYEECRAGNLSAIE